MAVRFCENCGHSVKIPHQCPNPEGYLIKQVLYAFWAYDICPYVLGGVVEEFTRGGNVKIRGYGGRAFRPIVILPGETGRDALRLITELREKYDEKEKELKQHFKAMTLRMIGLEE